MRHSAPERTNSPELYDPPRGRNRSDSRIVRREGALTALVDEELDLRISRRMSRIGVTYGAICVGIVHSNRAN
jgi:hypothetical protein